MFILLLNFHCIDILFLFFSQEIPLISVSFLRKSPSTKERKKGVARNINECEMFKLLHLMLFITNYVLYFIFN